MRKIVLLLVLAFAAVVASAQQTSMVVDNQTPGWLSSKINYGDQKTLVNLTVTGYINQTDVKFINQLINTQNLHGRLDLTNVELVGASRSDDNTMTNGSTEICSIQGKLEHLLLPEKLKRAYYACKYATCDSITLGGKDMPSITRNMFFVNITNSYKAVKCLIFREGVDSIGLTSTSAVGGESFALPNLECLKLPESLKKINTYAFADCTKLQNVTYSDSLQEIGNRAFWQVPAFQKMVRLPKNLNVYYVGSFENGRTYLNAYNNTIYDVKIYDKQIVYVPQSVSVVDFSDIRYVRDSVCYMHVDRAEPPTVKSTPYEGCENIYVYVPKQALQNYLADATWSKFNLLAESNPAKKVVLSQDTLTLRKGYAKMLGVEILPKDADSQNIVWNVDNEQVINVSQEGNVTGVNSGEATLYVSLKDNPILKDSCLVRVFQPVSSISLDLTVKVVNVGESFKLSATISPIDADNKKVLWKSSDEQIATVENGNVVVKKAGNVNIIATSESDSTLIAICAVTVLQPVEGISLDKSVLELDAIGEFSQLVATIEPEDASNNEIKWSSSNEKVCIVSNGKVVAVGFGTAVIVAKTVDGGYLATCTVTVKDTTAIEDIIENTATNYSVFTIEGKRISNPCRGVNIVRFDNGKIKKVIVK